MESSKETSSGTDDYSINSASLNVGDSKALKVLLEQRLNDCGWREKINQMIREALELHGVDKITHDQLAAQIIPNARAMVPDVLRKEMLVRVCELLQHSFHP